ncbi:hypothetical protein A9Q95_07725 [Rhodobacterales bacterium 59_46_T64]|nr:hypothetical protein A9Q95_07725 [Rhodobacterales bacterium 59_46_T64]
MFKIEKNALTERLGGYSRLSEHEMDFLISAQVATIASHKGDCLVRFGQSSAQVIVLLSGWAVMRSKTCAKGNQILHIYLPGDINGLTEIGSAHATHEVVMQTDGTICKISRRDFYQDLLVHPRLAALLFALASLDLAALRYHNACMSSMGNPPTFNEVQL